MPLYLIIHTLSIVDRSWMAIPVQNVFLFFKYSLSDFETLRWCLSVNCKDGVSLMWVVRQLPLSGIFSEILFVQEILKIFSFINLFEMFVSSIIKFVFAKENHFIVWSLQIAFSFVL